MDSTWKTLYKFSKGVRLFFVISVITSLIAVLFNFLTPQIIRITVDSVLDSKPFDIPQFLVNFIESLGGREFLRSNLYVMGLGVVLCALLFALFNFASRNAHGHFGETLVKSIRDRLYSHVQALPFAWHNENQTGDIIQRCTSDVDVIRNFVLNQLLQVIRTSFTIVVAVTLMFSMHLKLSLVALLFVPIIIGYSYFFYRRISRKFREADEAEGELTVTVQENLTGVRVVRAFGRERHELKKFDEKNNKYANLWINMGFTMGAYWGIGDFVTGAQVLSVIIFGAIFAARGELTFGDYTVFVTYTQMLAWPVRSLGRVLTDMSKTRVSVERLQEILLARPEDPEENGLTPDMRGDIVFDNVSFKYGNNTVLQNLSFTIPFGSTFGILGSTGSGKSTMTYLLNRLYELPEDGGKITIGGVDIKDIKRGYLRKNTGVVLQEPFLFSKTIHENIAITKPDATREDVRKMAAIAAVDDNIMGFGKGYETIVGERGVTLSGGQKQRVAIARTLMMDSPIVIFDDSMSAVDLETDASIRDALSQNTDERTVILIAHRINTLMHADLIMVLEEGKIAQLGSPSDLLKEEGMYKRIYEMQSKAAQGEVL